MQPYKCNIGKNQITKKRKDFKTKKSRASTKMRPKKEVYTHKDTYIDVDVSTMHTAQNFYQSSQTKHYQEVEPHVAESNRMVLWNFKNKVRIMSDRLTTKLKPVTLAKEVPIEAPARASSPSCPTNITDIICIQYWNRLTPMRGPASHTCFFTSSHIFFLLTSLIPLLLTACCTEKSSFSAVIWIKAEVRDFLASLSIFFRGLTKKMMGSWIAKCFSYFMDIFVGLCLLP